MMGFLAELLDEIYDVQLRYCAICGKEFKAKLVEHERETKCYWCRRRIEKENK